MSELSTSAPAHIATQQEKLDAVFGITQGKSVDEFLESLSIDQKKISDTMESIEQTVAENAKSLDECQERLNSGAADIQLQMQNIDTSLKEIEDMVSLAKGVLKHVAEAILATPLIDSEAVQALSKLIESIHISIAEFIQVYRDKQDFASKVKMSWIQLQQKKDFELYKHNLALERIKMKDRAGSVEADASSSQRVWSSDTVVKAMDKAEKEADNG